MFNSQQSFGRKKMKAKSLFIAFVLMFVLTLTCSADYDPKAVKAYNKGIDLTNEEKFEEAAQSFIKAIKLEPSFTDAYYNLGIIHQYLDNQETALEAYLSILNYTPEDYDVIHKIGMIYHTMGEREKAISYLKKIPQEDPNFGLIAELIKSLEKAQKDAEIAKKEAENAKQTAKDNEVKEITNIRKMETYAGFEGPTGIAKDSEGNLFVANFSDNSIIHIKANGERKVLAKGGAIKGPLGLAVDKYDNLYIANYESNQIVLMPSYDRVPQVLPFIVQKPYFLMIDESGVLFVTEQGSNSVSQHNIELE